MSTNHFAKFRYSPLERWLPLFLSLFCLTAAGLLMRQTLSIPITFLILGCYWIYRLFCTHLFHFILFEEEGVIVRKGLFLQPHHFRFDQITNIRTIKPDKHIHFLVNSKHEVQISLSGLEKKDRIRFIFLIESDVNRLAINAAK
jgi:hypothetical protein